MPDCSAVFIIRILDHQQILTKMSEKKTFHIIINPASGAKKTENIYKEEVLPYLKQNSPESQIHEYRTESEGHATEIIRKIIKSHKSNQTLQLILLGGDGTTHEAVNGLVEQEGKVQAYPANVAIVPTGTANALYASLYAKSYGESYLENKLRSVESMLKGNENSLCPLALSLVQTKSKEQNKSLIAHLITSHALHASILADSESLRDQYPGIERFKVAFGKNMLVWVPASIELKPLANGKILRYDPAKSEFIDIKDAERQMEDFILYFAALTTDRLEATFVPGPMSGLIFDNDKYTRPSDAVDIVIYRPLRSPKLSKFKQEGQDFWLGSQSQEKREEIGKTNLVKISGKMYEEGSHIKLTYKEKENEEEEEEEFEENGQGPVVIEYYRCGGYTWTPQAANARRTCIDGTVVESDQTDLRVLSKEEGAGKILIWG